MTHARLTHYVAMTLLLARLTLQEALRRRVLVWVAGLSAALLGLFAFAADQAMDAARTAGGTVTADVIGATLLGTAAFTGLLLGAVVAVFLSHSAVRGDAERGLLQPVIVRPVPRSAVVIGRALAGAAVAAGYTAALWLAAVVLVRVAGGWTPSEWVAPGTALALAVALVAVAAVAVSSLLGAMASGAVTLTLLGLGFTVGLLAQLSESLGLGSLGTVADAVSLALPFEGLYRHVLFSLSGQLGDLARLGIAVGPFGGAREAGAGTFALAAAWAVAAVGIAVWRLDALDA